MRGIVRCPRGCEMRRERSIHAPTSKVTCLQGITGGLQIVSYLRGRCIYDGREKTMRAIAVTTFGGPEVLQLTEVPQPQPGPGQVVIRVAYTGVNFAEIMGRRGDYHASTLPFVPGLEVSGHIHALGEGVEGLSIGQPVAAFTVTGGYADYVAASALLTFPLAKTLDLRTAAAFPTVVPTATALLTDVAHLQPGESVLVHAASGGVGTVAVQVARLLGAGKLIGVVSREEKREYARSFGYDDVLLQGDFADQVRELTGGRGADVILESVGGEGVGRGI